MKTEQNFIKNQILASRSLVNRLGGVLELILGVLGTILALKKWGGGIPAREQPSGPTPPGRGRGGVNPSLEGTGRDWG